MIVIYFFQMKVYSLRLVLEEGKRTGRDKNVLRFSNFLLLNMTVIVM